MRKRVEFPDSYVLNLDIISPVNRGEDQDGTSFYYLVGAFTVPCVGSNKIAQGLQEMGYNMEPNIMIMVDEEKDVRPWTSQDIEKDVEELENGRQEKGNAVPGYQGCQTGGGQK